MYPIEVYGLLVIIDFIIFIYSYIDINQRVYGNIVTLGIASLLSFYLAIASVSGTVVVNYASSTVTGVQDYLQDGGIMWFFILLGVIQIGFTLYFAYDAYIEYVEGRKQNGTWEGDY